MKGQSELLSSHVQIKNSTFLFDEDCQDCPLPVSLWDNKERPSVPLWDRKERPSVSLFDLVIYCDDASVRGSGEAADHQVDDQTDKECRKQFVNAPNTTY